MVWGYIVSAGLGLISGGGNSENGIDLKTLFSLVAVLAIVFIAVNLYLNFTDQTITQALGLDNLGQRLGESFVNNLINNNPISFLFGIGTGIGSALFARK